MNSKSYIFSSAKRNKTLHVTPNQMLLLKMIGSLGFVTSKQLDMLWSVIQQYPTTFSHTILSKWTVYDGLLNFVPISASLNINRSKRATTAVSHNCYVLSSSCSKWLNEINVLPLSWDNTAINSHNEQAVETIVQSLYTARFSSSLLNSILPFYTFRDGQYSYCSQAINGCSKKGVIKSAKEKGVTGAKHTVTLTLVPKKKVKPISSDATKVLSTITECLSSKTYRDLSDLLPYLTHAVDILHTDGSNLTPLIQYFDHQININNKPLYVHVGDGLSSKTSSKLNQSHPSKEHYSSPNTDFTLLSSNNLIHFIYYSPFLHNALHPFLAHNSFNTLLPLFRLFRDAPLKKVLRNFQVQEGGFFGRYWGHTNIKLQAIKKSRNAKASETTEAIVNLSQLNLYSLSGTDKGDTKEMLGTLLGQNKDTLGSFWGDTKERLFTSQKHLDTRLGSSSNTFSLSAIPNLNPHNWTLRGLFWETLGKAEGEAFKLKDRLNTVLFKNNNFSPLRGMLQGDSRNMNFMLLQNYKIPLQRNNFYRNTKSASHPKSKIRSTSYVAMPAKPHRYKNKMVKVDSKKFSKLSKETNYSDNLLTQQDQLLGLLNDDDDFSSTKKAAPHNKKETAYKDTHIKSSKSKILSYYYPNRDYLVQVFSAINIPYKLSDFSQLTLEQQVLLINIAEDNLHIYKYFVNHHQIADHISHNHLSLPLKTKFIRSQDKIDRDVDLISNPYLDLYNYDFRSFNQQFGFKNFAESKDLPFVADMMISFYRKHRRHEVFLELDNRTEANNTQIQKIMNYIWYALENPDKDIDMVIAITDGSLKSKRVPKYTNLGRKLGNLATQFIKTYLNTSTSNKTYLATLYRQATNLHIYLSGVSEAHLDIAKILLGSNDIVDKLITIDELTRNLSRNSRWSVKYIPSDGIKELQSKPDLLFSTGNDSVSKISNPNGKDIFRYLSPKINDSTLGMLKFTDKLTGNKQYQQIINANEHDLDTVIAMYNLIFSHKDFSKQISQVPISVYQHCLEVNTAILLPSYAKKFKYDFTYSPVLPYLIQPRYNDDLPNHKLIRWILVQYSQEIRNYYKFGAINKAALKKNPDYGKKHITHLFKDGHPRAYEDLHELANNLQPEAFIDQLRLDEVPLGLLKTLVTRWPDEAFYVPRFMPLPFVKTPKDSLFFNIKDKYQFKEFIHGLNSTLPDKRTSNIL